MNTKEDDDIGIYAGKFIYYYIILTILYAIIVKLTGFKIMFQTIWLCFIATLITNHTFLKHKKRTYKLEEKNKLEILCLFYLMILAVIMLGVIGIYLYSNYALSFSVLANLLQGLELIHYLIFLGVIGLTYGAIKSGLRLITFQMKFYNFS